MSDTTRTVVAIALGVIAIACIYLFIAIPNYKECRESGHSRLYCATTHLTR